VPEKRLEQRHEERRTQRGLNLLVVHTDRRVSGKSMAQLPRARPRHAIRLDRDDVARAVIRGLATRAGLQSLGNCPSRTGSAQAGPRLS
jgi:hypothetical protein